MRWMGRSRPLGWLLRGVCARDEEARLLVLSVSLDEMKEGFSDWLGEMGVAPGQPHSYSLMWNEDGVL